ncbi:MAG TPA: hypothetical protein VNL18_08580 [Gemmatimonadales bacterium]|nr:hypothetical protein [Gemmatimonadales bacterium]
MKQLIEAHYAYIVLPPLFRVAQGKEELGLRRAAVRRGGAAAGLHRGDCTLREESGDLTCR